jgi:oligoribonuclease NrnB/cAMP/cGMP phosphodiesterase (DHH superfamily)
MSKSNKPFLIICHNDLDGAVSAICIINHIKQKYGPQSKYILAFKTYKNINQFVERVLDDPERYNKIFIADISVNAFIAENFTNNVLLIDHHDTAAELKVFENCKVDVSGKHCGASLCYKLLLKDQNLKYEHLTKLVAIARDYDLWLHKLPNNIAKNMNFIYYKYWGEKFCERFENGFDKFNQFEKDFIAEKWKGIQEQLDSATFIDLLVDEDAQYHNKVGMYINEDPHIVNGDVNEVCQYALDVKKYKTIICVIPKRKQLSIRASQEIVDKGVHIGKICEDMHVFGFTSNGGGHAAAGGANYDTENNLEKLLEVYVDKIMSFNI